MKKGELKTNEARRRLRLAAMLGATALAAPFAVTPALAQGAEEATVDSNTIIVTAQRRSQALEDVPMTVAVISADTLSSSGVNTIRDLQNVTSGFSLNQSGTYPQPSVRGVTTTNSGSYENNVALFVDGLYQITPQVLNMDLPNVQAVQILKGPQGTLYGRNATGGAILIDTIDPGDVWTGNAEVTYGRFDDKRGRAYVAGPVADRVGISLAGTIRRTDGYYKKASLTTPGQFDGRTLGLKQESIRAKIKAELTEDFTATLAYNYLRASDPRGAFFTPIENVNSPYTGNNATRPRNLGEVAGDAFELDFKQHEGSLKLEYDTGVGTLRSITGYQRGNLLTLFDSDGTYNPSSISESRIIGDTWQESLDFTVTAIENVDLIIGGTYFHNKERYAPGQANVNYSAPAGSPAGTPFSSYLRNTSNDSTRTKEAFAGFIDLTFQATDRLSINVGGRYSEERQNIRAIKQTYCRVAAGCLVGTTLVSLGGVTATNYDATQNSKYSKFTPRASIRYEITPGTNVYASYSKGFKAGEWNGVIPFDDVANWRRDGQIGQETVDAFEIGLKSAGSRLRFDIAGFYYKYKDLQVSSVQFNPLNGQAGVILQNLPNARIYGVEANADFNVTDNFTIRAGATWLNARYGDRAVYTGVGVNPAGTGFNTNSDPLKVFPNRAFNIPALGLNRGPMAQDISGMQMARAPDFSGFIGFDYNIPQGDGGIRISANLKYTDSYVVTDPAIWGGELLSDYQTRLAANPSALPNNSASLAGTPYAARANEQRARQGGYVLLNASVTWTDPSDTYYVRIWGNNLTNETYAVHYRPSSGGTYIPIGEPLTYGGTVGIKF